MRIVDVDSDYIKKRLFELKSYAEKLSEPSAYQTRLLRHQFNGLAKFARNIGIDGDFIDDMCPYINDVSPRDFSCKSGGKRSFRHDGEYANCRKPNCSEGLPRELVKTAPVVISLGRYVSINMN